MVRWPKVEIYYYIIIRHDSYFQHFPIGLLLKTKFKKSWISAKVFKNFNGGNKNFLNSRIFPYFPKPPQLGSSPKI